MSDLWSWALRTYARPGVAEACLSLQDRHGQNVPLLLWTLWASRHGRAPDLERGAALARAWESEVTGPLRQVRRRLKAQTADVPDAGREALRARVKAAELESEQLLLAALEPAAPSGIAFGNEAELLAKAAEAYGQPAAPEVFSTLLGRL